MANATSPEDPWPVRVVAMKIGEWVARLGEVWVDGQIAQLTRRPGVATQFLTLRDPDANISLTVTCPRGVLGDEVGEGSRVVLRARPDFWLERGTLSLRASEVRPVGLGALLARLEQLRRVLAAEGLFAAERKRPVPFWPHTVGLISGRASAAERDVVENARRRLPGVRFRVESVATQGSFAVSDIVEALARLDADPDVEVIVIARGGGSVEDLLPFSDEALLRAVSGCFTPVVSAIGHEPDSPLLDLVADVRASTPTDAGKLIVPDVAEEARRITQLRDRALRCLLARLDREQHGLDALRGRPALAHPERDIARRAVEIADLVARGRRCMTASLDRAADDVVHLLARVRSLSPAATLERGYAIVQDDGGRVVRSANQTAVGAEVAIRLAHGRLTADVTTVDADVATTARP